MTLRVEISIVPFGDEEYKRKLWTFDISNIGRAMFGHCEYSVIEIDNENNKAGQYRKTILHRRNLGAIELVRKFLNSREEMIDEK